MTRKLLIVMMLTLICAFVIGGCASSKQNEKNKIISTQQLYNSKNQYIGNNSNDLKLLELLEIEDLGKYTIKLETSKQPYTLIIIFEDKNENISKEKFNNLMKNNSILLLALIENADKVEWSYPNEGEENITLNSITTDDANELVGKDIKSYGESVEELQELINVLNDKNKVDNKSNN